MGLGAGAAAVVVVAAVYFTGQPQETGAPAPVEAVAPAAPVAVGTAAPEAAPASADVAAPVAETAKDDAAAAPVTIEPAAVVPEAVLPSYDVVRVEPDGSATVAGKAAPGANVSLRVGGVEVAQAKADGQGNFVALFTLPDSDSPRLMSVVATGPDGAEVAGTEVLAVAPTAAPAAEPVVAPEAPAAATAPAVDQTVPDQTAVASAAETAAPEAPAAILVSPEGVKVVQPAADVPAEVAANVAIDSIAYAPDGAVQLGGHGQAGALLRLYLDAAPLTEVTVAPDGLWATALPDVAPGIYQLRVDQLGADGKVVSRFETPFKRETLEALAAAVAPGATAPAVVAEPAAEVALEPEAAPAVVTEAPAAVAAPDAGSAAATVPAAEPAAVAAEPAAAPLGSVAADPVPATAQAPLTVTVQPGFTLWGIAEGRYGDGVRYVQVFDANKDKIKDPDLIYPGQVFTIPAKE
ncbi:MAG: LysM peptidoglycan-binding domain-containing protein [Rhodobacteraceae bacterium]|nr:LysM peptidoglycan-binding domain-containing protein [Paracoccaceae bacterium]